MSAWLLLTAMMIVASTAEPVFENGVFKGWGFVVFKTIMIAIAYIGIRFALERGAGGKQ